MKPKFVLVVTDRETNAQVKHLGVDFLELRVDLFKGLKGVPGIARARRQFILRRQLGLPLILTVRSQKKEGAVKTIPETRKWELLQALLPLAEWVDIELSSPLCAKTVALAHALRKKVIVSVHDFAKMPPHLEQISAKAASAGADMVKIAAKAHSVYDFQAMLHFTLAHKGQKLVTMCVGEWGPMSRLFFPLAGSRWVYTFLHKATAPGQLDIHTIKKYLI